MRTAGKTLDDHMLHTTFIEAPPAEYEVGARNLASCACIGRGDIKAVRERVTDFLGAGERDAILAMPAMLCLPVVAVVAAAKGPAAMPTGKVEAAAREEVDVFGDSKGAAAKAPNEDGGGLAPAAGSDGSSTKSADGGTSEVRCDKKGHWRVDCTELLCSRCHGRGIAADVSPTSKEEAAGSDEVESPARTITVPYILAHLWWP